MPHRSDTGSDSNSESRPTAPKSGKVIDLQGYLAAERALDLLATTDPSDAIYPHRLRDATNLGASMLAVVARRLDSSRADNMDAFARALAAYPDHDEAVAYLQRAADDSRSSDSKRLGLAMLLEYALGVPESDDFLGTLRDPTTALALAFKAAVRHAPNSPILQNHVEVMLTQPSELLYALYSRLVALEGDTPAPVAQLLALHPDVELSLEIVEAMSAQGSRASVHTLALLEPSLSPEAAHAANRALHKFRLAGYSPRVLHSPDESCRALLSPIDGRGNRILSLLVPNPEQGNAPLMMELYMNEALGVVDGRANTSVRQTDIPRQAQPGYMHRYTVRNWAVTSQQEGEASQADAPNLTLSMLEVPFLYALDVLKEEVRRNWTSVTPLPLDYGLFCHRFWVFAEGLNEGNLVPELDESVLTHELVAREADLLLNPAFDSWYLASDSALEAAQEISTLSGGVPRELSDDNWKLLLPALIRLAHDEYGVEARNRYAHRLNRMSEWLRLAGQWHDAEYAASAANTMLKSPPETNLLVLRLVQRGLLMALGKLAEKPKHRGRGHSREPRS